MDQKNCTFLALLLSFSTPPPPLPNFNILSISYSWISPCFTPSFSSKTLWGLGISSRIQNTGMRGFPTSPSQTRWIFSPGDTLSDSKDLATLPLTVTWGGPPSIATKELETQHVSYRNPFHMPRPSTWMGYHELAPIGSFLQRDSDDLSWSVFHRWSSNLLKLVFTQYCIYNIFIFIFLNF